MSREISEGGGATTDGAGSVSLGFELVIRSGAEIGGGTTATACEPGARMGVMSRCGALGLGGTTAAFMGRVDRIFSRSASGVGGTMLAFSAGTARVLSLRTSCDGGIAFSVITGMRDEDCKPSSGAGPGTGLYAIRFATAESDCGKCSLGASTTFSRNDSPRATRMV
jgi:hypothetical protein